MARAAGWLTSDPVREELDRLEASLDEVTACHDDHLTQVARHLVKRGGKRIRPALLLLAASFGSCPPERRQSAAAAIELLHVAALYHDDVMDRAPIRRGASSANAQWGNQMATVAGTFLFSRATATLSSLGQEAVGLASQATLAACTGQLQEAEHAYSVDYDLSTYLEIVARKTATFFELPCRLGAALGGLSQDDARALGTYGRTLGVAFQLKDDALDLSGSPEEMGKPGAVDVREGVYALPVLLALRKAGTESARLRAILSKIDLTDQDVVEARRIIAESGSVLFTLNLASDYAHRAAEAIEGLPDGDGRESLVRLTRYTVLRST
jgi:heptaprenyl diphosphate synthase